MALKSPKRILLAFLASLAALGPFAGGIFSFVSAGCGTAASAPPVSLPAPVTGRITVTSPDESGVSLVVGDEGAVEADAIVHAVNETQESSVALRLLSLIPSASAQTSLPEICSRTFHACAVAGSDGSFEIEIGAAEGDEIAVELIDTSGGSLTDKIRHPVPRNIIRFPIPVVDVDLLLGENQLYILMAAFADPPENGRVGIFDFDTDSRTAVAFAGTGPEKIVVDDNSKRAAVIEVHEGFVGVVDLDCADSSCNLFNDLTSTVGNQRFDVTSPLDLVFGSQGGSILVASSFSDPTLTKIDLSTGSVTTFGSSNFSPSSGIAPLETKALDRLDAVSMSATIDPIAFVGFYEIAGVRTPVIGLVDGNAMSLLLNPVALPDNTVPTDVAFFQSQNKILVSDEGNDEVLVYSFSIDETTTPATATLTLEGTISDPDDVITDPLDTAVDSVHELAFVNAINRTEDRPDTVITIDLTTLSVVGVRPVGLFPSGLVWDSNQETLFVSTLKTQGVTFWTLSELCPTGASPACP